MLPEAITVGTIAVAAAGLAGVAYLYGKDDHKGIADAPKLVGWTPEKRTPAQMRSLPSDSTERGGARFGSVPSNINYAGGARQSREPAQMRSAPTSRDVDTAPKRGSLPKNTKYGSFKLREPQSVAIVPNEDDQVDASDVEEVKEYLEMHCDDLNKIIDAQELLNSLPDVNDVESDVKRQLLVEIRDKLGYCAVIARSRARQAHREGLGPPAIGNDKARKARAMKLKMYKMYGEELRRDMARRRGGQD